MTAPVTISLTRRAALAGIGAGGLGLAAAAAAPLVVAQEPAAELATHPVVGLWQFNGSVDPAQGPAPGFELYHGDGTYTTWGGWTAGGALGIWRPTGERTAEVLFVWVDTNPFPGGGEDRGTATFRYTVEVDAADATMTYSGGTIDVRDVHGALLFPAGPSDSPPSTRVTFDRNPMTGSTVGAPATPAAATPAP